MARTTYRIKISLEEIVTDDDGSTTRGRVTETDNEVELHDVGTFITDAVSGIAFIHTGVMPMHVIRLNKEKTDRDKIRAIKLIRAACGLGLKDSKDRIEGQPGTVLFYCEEYDDVVTYQKIFKSLGYDCTSCTVPVTDKKDFNIQPLACSTYTLFRHNPEFRQYV